jgi:hypothetical protein
MSSQDSEDIFEQTQVFVVRLWRERREIDGAAPYWRGVVEHVASGRRRFLQETLILTPFVALADENETRSALRAWRFPLAFAVGQEAPQPSRCAQLRRWLQSHILAADKRSM